MLVALGLGAPAGAASAAPASPFAPDPDRLSAGGPVLESGAQAVAAARGASTERRSSPPQEPPRKRWKLSNERTLSRFAFVDRRTWARKRPNGKAPKILELRRRQSNGGDELVLALSARRTSSGVWYRVRLSMRPNGRTGWVRARHLSDLYRVNSFLKVNRKRKRAVLLRGGKRVWKGRIGVGKSSSPTPRGRFYVRDRVIPYDRGGIYGKFAFGLSAYAPNLSDWPGGGVVGIHGTNQPGILPGAVSHGCIRLKNRDVIKLKRKMPLGTPVLIK